MIIFVIYRYIQM